MPIPISEQDYQRELAEQAHDRAVRRKALVDAVQAVRGMTTEAVARKVGLRHISMPQHHDDTLECAASCIEETLIAKLDAGEWMTDVREWAKSHPQAEHPVDDSRDGIYGAEVKSDKVRCPNEHCRAAMTDNCLLAGVPGGLLYKCWSCCQRFQLVTAEGKDASS